MTYLYIGGGVIVAILLIVLGLSLLRIAGESDDRMGMR